MECELINDIRLGKKCLYVNGSDSFDSFTRVINTIFKVHDALPIVKRVIEEVESLKPDKALTLIYKNESWIIERKIVLTNGEYATVEEVMENIITHDEVRLVEKFLSALKLKKYYYINNHPEIKGPVQILYTGYTLGIDLGDVLEYPEYRIKTIQLHVKHVHDNSEVNRCFRLSTIEDAVNCGLEEIGFFESAKDAANDSVNREIIKLEVEYNSIGDKIKRLKSNFI